jgi:hypothetical protein
MVNALATLGRKFDNEIVPTLQANGIAKMLMPVNPAFNGLGLGVLSVETMNYVARSSAVIEYDIQQEIGDPVDVTGNIIKIPVQQDDSVIKRRNWDAYIQKGVPLESDLAQDMAVNVAVQQNALVVNGWAPNGTDYLIKGMYQVAGNTYGGADSGTFGNVLKNVAQAIVKLKEDKIYSRGYNLGLAPFNAGELDSSLSNGIAEYQLVLDLLNKGFPKGTGPGQIIECEDLAAGTGFVAPVPTPENKRFMDLAEPQIPVNQVWYQDGNEESGDIKIRQIGAMVPRFKHLTAAATDPCICTITGMGSS